MSNTKNARSLESQGKRVPLSSIVILLCIISTLTTIGMIHYKVMYDEILSQNSGKVPVLESFKLPYKPSAQKTKDHNLLLLPQWIRDYMNFHKRTRERKDFPHAPNIKFLIVTCPQARLSCGGLADRMKSFDFYVHMANKTGRVLLYYWGKPRPIEDFLVPPEGGMDWRVPSDLEFDKDYLNICRIEDPEERHACEWGGDEKVLIRKATQKDQIFYMNSEVWTKEDVDRAKSFTKASLSERIYGHQTVAVRQKGSQESILISGIQRVLFDSMFQPAPLLDAKIQETMRSLGLTPGHYGAAHIRASYPTMYARNNGFRGKNGADYDKSDHLLLEGNTKDFTMDLAHHAVKCASGLTLKYMHHEVPSAPPSIPIYVASDSVDTINLLMSESKSQPKLHLVSLPSNGENLHFDAKEFINSPVEDFYSVFVDLWLLKNAACVSYGVGWYGYFGALLTGNACMVQHQSSTGKPLMNCND